MAAANGFVTAVPDARYGTNDANVYCRAQRFTAGGTGTQEITRIGCWAHAAVVGKVITFAIFTDDAANTKPDTVVADSTSDEMTLTYQGGGADVEVAFTYLTRPTVTGGTAYWLVVYSDGGGDGYLSRVAAGGTSVFSGSGFTYPNVPTGDGWHSYSAGGGDLSLYAVYEGEGGPPGATGTVVSALTLLGVG